MATHVVIGTGPCPKEAVTEALRDALSDGDTLGVAWSGSPVPESVGAVYDYILDHEIDFVLMYADEQKVHSAFREAEHGVVQKSRNPNESLLKALDGKVLFLWNDDDPGLIEQVFDSVPDATVLELSNGLAPIILADEEAPQPEAPVAPVEEEEDDYRYTREELEMATAYVVKRYGERMGCTAKTKSGIIAELFDESEWEKYAEPSAPVVHEASPELEALLDEEAAPANPPQGILEQLDAVIENFFENAAETIDAPMARLKLSEARLWVTRAIEGR